MKRVASVILMLCCGLLLAGIVPAAEPLVVDELAIPELQWGDQQADVTITNPSGYVRYVIAETEVQFEGDGLNPNRRARSVAAIFPQETRVIRPKIVIPGNYGAFTATVRLFDVVDTLDIVLPNMLFYDSSLSLSFDAPESVKPYLEHKITMPPRVNVHPDFDNELSRLLLLFLNEGMSFDEILSTTGGDSIYVDEMLQKFQQKRYVANEGESWTLEMPFITIEEATAETAIARRVADSLVAMYTTNLPRMTKVRDSMAAAGAISSDTIDFLNGAVPLYKPYPMIGMFSLWSSLGRAFITRSAPLHIFDATDVCNAYIPFYMYATQGPDSLNGHHFYAIELKSYPQYLFGDRIPVLECDPDFIRKGMTGQRIHWRHADGFAPDVYMYDSTVINAGVRLLEGKADSLLRRTYDELLESAVSYGHPKLSYGHRYWFWNIVATRTLERLHRAGVVDRNETGQYRFDLSKMF